ncbi:MAG TPA: hypothetical protein PLH39_02325 [Promineifilum sp.]|nr:hypothetical protein [Promineifilum sp.]
MLLHASPGDLLVLALVVLGRLLLPLLIPWFPLPAIVACLVLDGIDQTLFQGLTRLQLDFYQTYDKALDVYYLAIAYLSTLRNWDNRFAFRVARALYYLRLAGVALFELTEWRVLLFLLPNTFEYFFIWYELLRLYRDPRALPRTTVISAAAAIWILVKLPQEYWLHIARLDVTDVLKTALFHASPETPWGHVFLAAPWLFAGGALLLAGIVVALAALAGRRLPVMAYADARPAMTLPLPHRLSRADLSVARAAWARDIFDRDLAEKLVLTALLTSIFAQMLPGLALSRPAATLPVVAGAVGVVVLTTMLSHVLVRRGIAWTNTLGQFLVMLAANFTVAFLYQALPGARDLPDVAVIFFVFLLSVIVTLFDRFQIIQRARWTTPRERAAAA